MPLGVRIIVAVSANRSDLPAVFELRTITLELRSDRDIDAVVYATKQLERLHLQFDPLEICRARSAISGILETEANMLERRQCRCPLNNCVLAVKLLVKTITSVRIAENEATRNTRK